MGTTVLGSNGYRSSVDKGETKRNIGKDDHLRTRVEPARRGRGRAGGWIVDGKGGMETNDQGILSSAGLAHAGIGTHLCERRGWTSLEHAVQAHTSPPSFALPAFTNSPTLYSRASDEEAKPPVWLPTPISNEVWLDSYQLCREDRGLRDGLDRELHAGLDCES